MKLKRILLTLFLAMGLTGLSFAGPYDDWPDDAICMWLDMKPTHEGYLAEAKKRSLTCEGGKAVAGAAPEETTTSQSTTTDNKKTSSNNTSLSKDSAITIYDVEFSASVLKELLGKLASKTDYDFSQHKIASNPKDIRCTFNIRRVVYDFVVEGEIEGWDVARGSLLIADGKVSINDGSFWRMGGLSTDKTYLKDEVNIRLTKDGHFVGKMAYFIKNTEQGEVAEKPRYPRLKKHKNSKPLNLNSPRKAELWIDFDHVDDQWAGGVWFLTNCKQIATSISATTKVTTSDDDPTVSKVIEVIHGDTFIVDIAEPHELAGSNIKLIIRDANTPDATKSCSKQMELGIKVKDIVTQKLADASSIKLKNFRKTSTAVIAQVIVDGKDLGEELLAKGYASSEYGHWKAYFCSALQAMTEGDSNWKYGRKDADKAIFWYERAIFLDPDRDQKLVTYDLSELYSIKGDSDKSLDYLQQSAKLGHMEAEEALGAAYMNGDGVSKDPAQAKKWLKKAHENGSKDAEDICGCEF